MDIDHNRADLDGESIFCPEEEGHYRPGWTKELQLEKKEGWAKCEEILMLR